MKRMLGDGGLVGSRGEDVMYMMKVVIGIQWKTIEGQEIALR